MNNELTTTNNNASIQPVGEDVLLSFLDTLGIGANLDEKDKKAFLNIAKAFNLNPFKREIHVAKYGTNPMSLITGYEVYIKRAERTGQLNGWDVKITGSVEANDLTAIITIHRKDQSIPFTWEVYYDECVQKKQDGTPTAFWKKPKFMLKKVAISQGFRLCFSDELAGMPYTTDELPEQAPDIEEGTVTILPADNSKKQKKVLEPGTDAWKEAIKAIQTNQTTLDYVLKHRAVTAENKRLLEQALEEAA